MNSIKIIIGAYGSFTLVRFPQWTVVFMQRDGKFSISALMQSTVANIDCCI